MKSHTRFDRASHGTPTSTIYSDSDILNFNRQHDQRYRWSTAFCNLYFNPPAGHVIGPPGLSKLKEIHPTEELDAIIHEWHSRQAQNLFI